MLLDLLLDIDGAAYWPLHFVALVVLVHPGGDRAILAEELLADLAVVPNIFEIKFLATFLIFTGFGLGGSQNQLLGVGFSRQIQRAVASRVLHLDVYTTHEEALQDTQVTCSSSLVHR